MVREFLDWSKASVEFRPGNGPHEHAVCVPHEGGSTVMLCYKTEREAYTRLERGLVEQFRKLINAASIDPLIRTALTEKFEAVTALICARAVAAPYPNLLG